MSNGQRAIRQQNDDLGDEMTALTAQERGDDPSLTRQEQEPDSNINNIIQKYNVDSFNTRQPYYGDWNFDRTFHDTLKLLDKAKELANTLPDTVRDKYPDLTSILIGLETGELETLIRDDQTAALQERTPEPQPTPAPEPPTP
jgi:hypothetical protein